MTLASDAHGLIAKLDLIEGSGSVVTPVDYKRGAPKDMPDGPEAWPADRAQLVVQALILREHGYTVHEALAFAYALLTKDLTIVCHAVGFDPFVGFYHQRRRGSSTNWSFTRYAIVQMPNGVALEIVEPKEGAARLYGAPMVSITVDNVAEARQELESRRTEFVTPIFDTGGGWGWTYFRAPCGTVYQLQGPYREKRGPSQV